MAFGFGRKDDDSIDWIRDPDDDSRPRDKQFERRRAKETHGNVVRYTLIGIAALLVAILYYQMNPVAGPAAAPGADLDPAGKAQAWSMTEQWLASKPLGDGARIVSWDGSRAVEYTDASKTLGENVHTFTVATAMGWWRVDTTVTDDGALAGYPSAERVSVPATAMPGTTGDWTTAISTLNASQTLATLVQKWGTALAGSDSDMLTVVMRDPDPAALYQAQAIGTAASVKIEKASYLDRGKVDKNDRKSDRAALRVTIAIAARSQTDSQTSLSYDVLVADPDGAPAILAWGAPGTGDRLAEYANRLPAGTAAVDYSKQGASAQSAAADTQAAAQ